MGYFASEPGEASGEILGFCQLCKQGLLGDSYGIEDVEFTDQQLE